ncbi:MAG: ParB/RepB/Spo0J family partition protein, partial [Pseudomonadota bacterium]
MAGKAPKKGLGRGLSALLADTQADPVGTPPAAQRLPVDMLAANPDQPRRVFSEEALNELAASIGEKGVLQPLIVRPHPEKADQYQIVAGERRWRAAQRAGLATVPAVVRDLDELQLLEVGIIENVQREDLNPIEEAEAYGALIKRFGRTQEDLAESVGKSRAHIANTMRLLNLGESSREHLRQGRISA